MISHPTRRLEQEHDWIQRALAVLSAAAGQIEAGVDVPPEYLERLVGFFAIYADRLHHAKEEGVLFPALQEAGLPPDGGPVAVMLHEHELGRSLLRRMGKACESWKGEADRAEFLEAAHSFVGLLSAHIEKENQILFPMARNLLGSEVAAGLHARFDEHEQRELGPGAHDRYHALVEELEQSLTTRG